MIRNFYITIPRVILLILEIAAIWFIGAYVMAFATGYKGIIAICVLTFIAVALGSSAADIFQTPPYDLDLPVIEYDTTTVSLNDYLGETVYDSEENKIGVCVGAYFTQEDIYFMVKDENGKKLYYANEVYFNEEEYEWEIGFW